MTGLLPILALMFLAVMVVLWAGTVFLQGYLYSEPVAQAYWRAPAAALALTLFLAFWCSLDYRNPGRYGALLDVPVPRDEKQFLKFRALKKGKELPYAAHPTGPGRYEYRDAQGKVFTRSDTEGVVEAIVVEGDDGQKIRFDAELTPDGKFKAPQGQPVRYVEAGGQGRVMTDQSLGKVAVTLKGLLIANFLLNIVHLVLWFLCLWLLLRFQWSHALGLGLVLWVVLTFLLPTLFKKTEDLAKQQAVPAAAPTSAAQAPLTVAAGGARPGH